MSCSPPKKDENWLKLLAMLRGEMDRVKAGKGRSARDLSGAFVLLKLLSIAEYYVENDEWPMAPDATHVYTEDELDYEISACEEAVGADDYFADEELAEQGDEVAKWSYALDYEELSKSFSQLLGEGAYAKVWLGKWQGRQVAVKVLKWDDSLDDAVKERIVASFVRETELLSRLDHPFILEFVGACSRPPYLAIVSEYADRGTLKDWLYNREREFPWLDRLRIALQVAHALDYLHNLEKKVIHRDIKSENVLLVGDDADARLADFGLHRIKEPSTTFTRKESTRKLDDLLDAALPQRYKRARRQRRSRSKLATASSNVPDQSSASSSSSSSSAHPLVPQLKPKRPLALARLPSRQQPPEQWLASPRRRGTDSELPSSLSSTTSLMPRQESYMAYTKGAFSGTPGFIARELYDRESFNEKVDVFSFGMLLWELISRSSPLPGKSAESIERIDARARLPEIPLHCPPIFAKLIEQCWHDDAIQRPSFMEIIAILKLCYHRAAIVSD
jgi:serine/threonine protein kinase